jgi:hypothetical protein
VYYADSNGALLRELYRDGDRWKFGGLSKTIKTVVKKNSSISAVVTRTPEGVPTGLKVYASQDGLTNASDLPNIQVFSHSFGDGEWQDAITITSKVTSY